jgi:hypothetical protein
MNQEPLACASVSGPLNLLMGAFLCRQANRQRLHETLARNRHVPSGGKGTAQSNLITSRQQKRYGETAGQSSPRLCENIFEPRTDR